MAPSIGTAHARPHTLGLGAGSSTQDLGLPRGLEIQQQGSSAVALLPPNFQDHGELHGPAVTAPRVRG